MQIVYNGVGMSVMQETWQYEMASISDDSQVDYLFTRHAMVCRSVVNGAVDIWRGQFIGGRWFRNGPAITFVRGNFGSSEGISEPRFVPPIARNSQVSNPVPLFYGDIPGVANVPPGTGIDGQAPGSFGTNLVEVVSVPNRATLTIEVIRQRLMSPRGKLFVLTVDSEAFNAVPSFLTPYLLESPEPGMVCDAKNGPFPKVLSIDRVHGNDETFIITFAVETYKTEAFKNGVSTAGVLLSNRFTQTAATDDRSFTTLFTEGKAIFRTDLLYAQNRSPDELRSILMLKIPQGFQRENIQVTGLPDVTGVAYQFADRQLPVQFPGGPASGAQKIVAVHRSAIINNNQILQGALAAYDRVLGLAANKRIAEGDPNPANKNKTPKAAARQVFNELPN